MNKIDKIVTKIVFAAMMASALSLGHLSAPWRKRTFDDVPVDKYGHKTTLACIKFTLTDV